MSPRPGHSRSLLLCILFALAARSFAAAEESPTSGDRPTAGAIEHALLDAGLENLSVAPGDGIQVAYENRRYRRSVDALALARAAAGAPVLIA